MVLRPLAEWSPLRIFGSLTLLITLSGCATTTSLQLNKKYLHTLAASRGINPSHVIDPLQLNEEVRAWAHETAPPSLPSDRKLTLLLERLLDPEEMSLEYQWGFTGTATEVFESRKANCMAFTNLFVALAREVGAPVFFMAVQDSSTYRKHDNLVVVSDHIVVGYNGAETGSTKIFDFSERRNRDYRSLRTISDLTALSMFHSNRGAEALQGGEASTARRWLEVAAALDPGLSNAWVNLGVVYRRLGQLVDAERSYRNALEIDPRLYSAYNNLASLLRLQNRLQEAEDLELLLAKAPSRNPYTYLSLGDISLQRGRIDEAARLYRRAVNLGCEDASCFAALGQLAAQDGKLKTAKKMLRKAEEIDAENPRAQQLSRMVRAGSSGPTLTP